MKTTKTYHANIYVGLQEGYDGIIHSLGFVEDICAAYCDSVGLCVTVTPTTFVYSHGREPGAIVGLINYPRFPKEPVDIRAYALTLAENLRGNLNQLRVTAEFTDETVLLEKLEGE